MKTIQIGQKAEKQVAALLKDRGFRILGRNWKTKVCEIDIIAQKEDVIYFVEVKYRRQEAQGSGVEYITPKKLNRLHFAAEIWNQQHGWNGDWRLVAAAVSANSTMQLIEIE